jgi:hypothetical protein
LMLQFCGIVFIAVTLASISGKSTVSSETLWHRRL